MAFFRLVFFSPQLREAADRTIAVVRALGPLSNCRPFCSFEPFQEPFRVPSFRRGRRPSPLFADPSCFRCLCEKLYVPNSDVSLLSVQVDV